MKPKDIIRTISLPALAAMLFTSPALRAQEPAGGETPLEAAAAEAAPAPAQQAATLQSAPLMSQPLIPAAEAEPAKPKTAADCFVSAPTEVFPTIDRTTRLDMIDYFNAGSSKASKNLVNGSCRVVAESPEQITVETSPVSEYTISLLPSSDKKLGDRIIMLITTLRTPAEDSSVKFYTLDWREIPGMFRVPLLDDWLLPEAAGRRADVENAVPFVIAKITYYPEQKRAVLTHDLPSFIAEDMLGVASSSMKDRLSFRWDGKRLVLEK